MELCCRRAMLYSMERGGATHVAPRLGLRVGCCNYIYSFCPSSSFGIHEPFLLLSSRVDFYHRPSVLGPQMLKRHFARNVKQEYDQRSRNTTAYTNTVADFEKASISHHQTKWQPTTSQSISSSNASPTTIRPLPFNMTLTPTLSPTTRLLQFQESKA